MAALTYDSMKKPSELHIDAGAGPENRARHTATKSPVAEVIALVRCWGARASQRRQLAALTAWELDDIGVTAPAAKLEAAKPFWRA